MVIVLIGATAFALSSGRNGAGAAASRSTTTSTTASSTPSSSATPETPKTLTDAELVRLTRKAVWRVETTGCGFEGSGSAWVIDSRHLVTNAHVVAHDPHPTVRSSNGRSLAAKVVGIRNDPDLAVLRVTEDLPVTLDWADTGRLSEGDHVVGLGYPVPGTDFSASPGTVVSFQNVGRVRVGIRTDAALDRGNSGGPLVTSEGQVAGVITEMAENSGGFQMVPVAYTSAHLADDVSAMIGSPATPEADCAWVGGNIEYPSLPDLPYDDSYIDDTMEGYYDYDYDYDYEPELPEPTTTTTLPCPTGKPTVSVTEVQAEPVDPEYSPGYWSVTVKGTIRNDTAAEVSISSVTVRIAGARTDSYGYVTGYALRPGASTTFEANEYYLEASSPDSATAKLDDWSWGSWEFYDCGTG